MDRCFGLDLRPLAWRCVLSGGPAEAPGARENRRLRHGLEVRNEHFLDPEVVRSCRRHGVALVFSDSGDWPYVEEVTAGFVYLRLHGSPDTSASDCGEARLSTWAGKLRAWTGGGEPDDPERITELSPPERKSRDAYVYFDNDAEGHAPHNAMRLMELLGSSRPGAAPEVPCDSVSL